MFRGALLLNGGSSSGTSSIARCLQRVLDDEPWLLFGIDSFIDSLPLRLQNSEDSIKFDAEGRVLVGEQFRSLEQAWMAGIAAIVGARTNVIVDDVFLGGSESQSRWRAALQGLPVRFVGVRCAGDVAAGREQARGDRVPGMAVRQAGLVHEGVDYDFEVDTTAIESLVCAEAIASYLRGVPS